MFIPNLSNRYTGCFVIPEPNVIYDRVDFLGSNMTNIFNKRMF